MMFGPAINRAMACRAAWFALWFSIPVSAAGQSSSLLIGPPPPPQPFATDRAAVGEAPLAQFSFIAVPRPDPRRFAKDDLITVIIRESTESDWESSLGTSKEVKFKGAVKDLPDLSELLHFNLEPANDEAVQVDIDFKNEFAGDGDVKRSESMTGRIQARVIDLRPNGTLVLEARKYNQMDQETLTLILTGTCRAEDVSVDNTILSSQLYDLHLVKNHDGELRKASRKGVITRLVEFFLNF